LRAPQSRTKGVSCEREERACEPRSRERKAIQLTGAPLVLASHGSRDPRSAATMVRLARRVRAHWPGPVVAAFLDFNMPSIPDTLRVLAPIGRTPIVVPMLLTSAYHGRVDLPAVLAEAGASRLAPVLGPGGPGEAPDPLLMAALRRRLSELDTGAASTPEPADGLVLIAAGTSHAPARSTVDAVAAGLDLPCVVGYASASGPTAGEAVEAVRAMGARRILVASYFLAVGRLYEAAAASARAAGATGVAEPLGDAEELVRLIVARAQSVADRELIAA
jgi:sirohydrochlorin ferrochelatase